MLHFRLGNGICFELTTIELTTFYRIHCIKCTCHQVIQNDYLLKFPNICASPKNFPKSI